MNAVKFSWGRTLRGGRRGRHRAAAVFLGFVAGAVGGWNLTGAAVLLAALGMNTSLFWLAASIACGACWNVWAANLNHAVGVFLLDKLRLGAALDSVSQHPLVAMFRLDEYLIFGGAATAALAALPAAHLAARFGSRRLSNAATSAVSGPDPWLRPFGTPLVCVGAAVVFLLMHAVGPRLTAEALLERLSIAAQTPVAADRVDYDPWSGELRLTGLRFGDSGDPARIGLEIDQVRSQVDPKLFLAGRLHAAEMTLSGVRWNHDASATFGAPDSPGPTMLREGAPAATVDDPTRAVEVQTYLRHRDRLQTHLYALGRLVAAVERVADLESPEVESLRRLQADEFRCAPRESATGRSVPLVNVKRMRVVDLHDLTELSAHAQLELTNVTSRPSGAARLAQLTLSDGADACRLNLTFHLGDTERRHDLHFALRRIPADELIQLDPAGPLDLQGATIETLRGQGYAARERFAVRTSLDVEGVRVRPNVERLAGLSGELWRQGLARMPQWHFAFESAGRWSSPSVTVLPAAVVADFKHQLRTAGAHELVQAIETGKFSAAPETAAARPTSSTLAAATAAATPVGSVAATPNLSAETPPAPYPTTGVAAAAPLQSPFVASTGSPKSDVLAVAAPGGVAKPADEASSPIKQAAATTAVDETQPTSAGATRGRSGSAQPVALAAADGSLIAPPVVEMPREPTVRLEPATTPAEGRSSPAAQPARLGTVPAMPHRSLVSAAGRATPPAFAGDEGPALGAAPVNSAAAPASRPVQAPVTVGPARPSQRSGLEHVRTPPAESPAASLATDDASHALQAEDRRNAARYPNTNTPRETTFGPRAAVVPGQSATAGLRQPTGIAEPSALPGPMNLSTGYDHPGRRRSDVPTPNFPSATTPRSFAPSTTIPAPALPSPRSPSRSYGSNLPAPQRSPSSLPLPEDEVEEPAPEKKPLFGGLSTLFGKRPTGFSSSPSIADRHSVHVDENPPTAKPTRTGLLPKIRTWFNRAPSASELENLEAVDPGPYLNDGSDASTERDGSYAVQSDYETEANERPTGSSNVRPATAARPATLPEAEAAAPRARPAAATPRSSDASATGKLPPPRDLTSDDAGVDDAADDSATPLRLSADRPWYDRIVR